MYVTLDEVLGMIDKQEEAEKIEILINRDKDSDYAPTTIYKGRYGDLTWVTVRDILKDRVSILDNDYTVTITLS